MANPHISSLPPPFPPSLSPPRLAIVQALAKLKARLPAGGEKGSVSWSDVHLVMAGGYDSQNTENIEHYKELTDIVDAEGLGDGITFLRSFSDAQKIALLERCNCLLYTPSNEHFGIVPIESMYCRRPVIAVNSGGPLETVAVSGVRPEVAVMRGALCTGHTVLRALTHLCSDGVGPCYTQGTEASAAGEKQTGFLCEPVSPPKVLFCVGWCLLSTRYLTRSPMCCSWIGTGCVCSRDGNDLW